jgi:hypothetical protein
MPPFFSTWNQVYIFMVVSLVAMIGFLYWFSKLY